MTPEHIRGILVGAGGCGGVGGAGYRDLFWCWQSYETLGMMSPGAETQGQSAIV